MINYQEAATRLGIPEEDRSGFVEFVSAFAPDQSNRVKRDLFEHLKEDYGSDGQYHGSELERHVLETRLEGGMPLTEAVAIANRLASFDTYQYGLLASVLMMQLTRDGGSILGKELAVVMGVPDEDRFAFVELLYNWVDEDEAWQAQVKGRGYSVEIEPIPRTVLNAFWERYPLSEPYRGSSLEGDMLAERAMLVRSIKDVKHVLSRTFEHANISPDRRAFELRGVFACLEEALSNEAFEERQAAQPLRAAA